MDSVEELWTRYCNEVDTPSWAISLPMAQYLAEIIRNERPQQVLDLGAGFSSILFRHLSVPYVATVDTDIRWIEKVDSIWRRLQPHYNGLNWFLIDDIPHHIYDLVFVDLGYSVRPTYINRIHRYTDRLAIVDDMHEPIVQEAVSRFLSTHGKDWRSISLPQTLDGHGRFATKIQKHL